MPEIDQNFNRISALSQITETGYFGCDSDDDCGVTLTTLASVPCVLINARKNQQLALTKLLKKHYALSLPTPLSSENSNGISLRWFGFDQWLLIGDVESNAPFFSQTSDRLLSAASVCDQSHGRTIITVSGPRAKALLEKGMSVDLHESNFNIGSCAVTDIGHISVHICQTNTQEYEISCNRSFSQSLWDWSCEMSLEFGYKIV